MARVDKAADLATRVAAAARRARPRSEPESSMSNVISSGAARGGPGVRDDSGTVVHLHERRVLDPSAVTEARRGVTGAEPAAGDQDGLTTAAVAGVARSLHERRTMEFLVDQVGGSTSSR